MREIGISSYRTVRVANRLELRSVTTARASCHWPAAARFTEHGQLGIVTGYRPKF